MNTEKLLVGRPTGALRELNAVLAFEQDHEFIKPTINENFGNITEKLYLLKDFDVVDSCQIDANSDIRSCVLSFPKINTKGPRKIVSLATNYALINMSMQESFVFVDQQDKTMIRTLNNLGYESLGKEQETETFIKESDMLKESEATKWR